MALTEEQKRNARTAVEAARNPLGEIWGGITKAGKSIERFGRDITGETARREAQATTEKGAKQALKLKTPELKPVSLDLAKYVGDYDPRLQGRTELENINVDPRFRQAQIAALEGLGRYTGVGNDAIAQQEVARATTDADMRRRAALAALQQQQAMRGMADSGSALAQQQMAAQADIGDTTALQMQARADAQRRALQALGQQAELASQIRGQEFGEQRDVTSAQEAINRFNVMAQNQAALRNIEAQQKIEDQRAAIENQQRLYNQQLAQQQFQNELARTNLATGAYGNIAAGQQRASDRQAGLTGGVLGLIGQIGGAAIGGN